MRDEARIQQLDRELHNHRFKVQFCETNIRWLLGAPKREWRKIKKQRKAIRRSLVMIRQLRDEQRLVRGF